MGTPAKPLEQPGEKLEQFPNIDLPTTRPPHDLADHARQAEPLEDVAAEVPGAQQRRRQAGIGAVRTGHVAGGDASRARFSSGWRWAMAAKGPSSTTRPSARM